MRILHKVLGRNELNLSRLHDEKGNLISIWQAHELPLTMVVRLAQAIFDRPHLPWIPFGVITELSRILKKNSRVLEFGSGRSTVWLARRALKVVSIEDNKEWFARTSSSLAALHIDTVDYRFRREDAYVDTSEFESEYFDLIIVDGEYRTACIRKSSFALKLGGFLYLDNSDKDMTVPNGDLRSAEAALLELADKWGSTPRYYVGYAPGQFYPHQGILLQRPLQNSSK